MEGNPKKNKRTRTIQLLLESSYGDLNEVIPPLTNELGQAGTANRLKVSQTFISRWLRENGYKLQWIKHESA